MLGKKVGILTSLSIIIVIAVSIVVRFFVLNRYEEDKFLSKKLDVDFYEYVSKREFEEKDNEILIGKNKKELSNGYFDIKIKMTDEYISVDFNKLYKEEYVKEIYVDESYLYEIINFINVKYELGLDERSLQSLVILIKDKYTEYRNNNVETNLDINITQIYNVKISVQNCMLNLKISKI